MINSAELLIAAGILVASVLAVWGLLPGRRLSGEDNRTALGIGA